MSKFKAPDLSAPRFRANATNVLNRKLFNKFLKKYPKYKDKLELSEFKDIVRTFNDTIVCIFHDHGILFFDKILWSLTINDITIG